MSDSAATQPQLPSPQEADQILFSSVISEAFFNKLAELGHVPANQQEAFALLEIGGRLAVEEQKQAAATGTYGQIKAAVESHLAQQAVTPSPTNDPELALARKQAFAIAHDPSVYAAVISRLNASYTQPAQA